MRKLRNLIRSLSIVLALILLCSTSAFALTPAPDDTTAVTLPPPISSGDTRHDPPSWYFGLVLEDVSYDAPNAQMVYVFQLDSASKIAQLIEYCDRAYALQSELRAIQKFFNDPSYCLDRAIYSGQEQTLRDMLSSNTLALLTDGMDAYTFLNLVKEQPDYQQPAVRKFVDDYLNYTLSCNELRRIMNSFIKEQAGGPNKTNYYTMPFEELLTEANAIAYSEQFQNFMAAMQPFLNRSHDSMSLRYFYSTSELDGYYQALCTVTRQWWGCKQMQLDGYVFTYRVPVIITMPVPSNS